MKAKATILSCLVPFALVACGGGLSEEDAGQAFAATNAALAMGQADAQASRNALVSADQDSWDIDFTYNCIQGGTIGFAGTLASAVAGQFSFDYTTTFNDCVSSGITLNGNLDYAVSVSGDDTSYSFSYTFDGDMDYSGSVEGSCSYDFTMEGGGGVGAASFSFDGSICGHDANGTLSYAG